jgi:hypothetical protein
MHVTIHTNVSALIYLKTIPKQQILYRVDCGNKCYWLFITDVTGYCRGVWHTIPEFLCRNWETLRIYHSEFQFSGHRIEVGNFGTRKMVASYLTTPGTHYKSVKEKTYEVVIYTGTLRRFVGTFHKIKPASYARYLRIILFAFLQL